MCKGTEEKDISAIIKVTNHCNYRCDYCFIEPNTPREEMPYKTLRCVIEKLLSSENNDSIQFIWHGGEPLLGGREFFDNVIALQDELNIHGKEYQNLLQTNGSLLNDTFIDFFKENGFKIGLSLDGPRQINDSTRIKHNARGTYDTTLEKIRELHKHGLTTGAIATITRRNHESPEELYKTFKDNNVHLKLGQLVNSGRTKPKTETLRLLPEEYGEFAKKLFDIWINDEDQVIRISPFDSILRCMCIPDETPTDCIYAGKCNEDFIGVSPNGDLYPCGLYQGYKEFCYGNIHKMRLDEIDKTHPYKLLEARKDTIKRLCGGCDYIQLCHGGCSFSAFSNNEDLLSRDYYCESFRMIFKHISDLIGPEPEDNEELKERVKEMGGGGGYGKYSVIYTKTYHVWDNYAVVV